MTPLELAVSRGSWELATSMLLYGAPSTLSCRSATSTVTSNTRHVIHGQIVTSSGLEAPTTTAPPGGTVTSDAGSASGTRPPSASSSVMSTPSRQQPRLTSSSSDTIRAGLSAKEAASSFHKLRFLRALLDASFVTPGNVARLVDLDLLTPDLVNVIHRNLFTWEVTAAVLDWSPNDFHLPASHSSQAYRVSNKDNFPKPPRSSSSLGDHCEIHPMSSYDRSAVDIACAGIRQGATLRHQSRLAVRRLLATSLPAALPHLGLPERVQNYLTLGKQSRGRAYC
jgi:hypothetical protein